MKKTSDTLYFVYAFLISAAVMLTFTAIAALILLKSGMGNALVGASAALAAFIAALAGSIYSGKATNNPYSALISGGIFLGALALISLGASDSRFSIPFAVPLACIAGGVIPFIALSKASKSSSSKVKKVIKRRRRV